MKTHQLLPRTLGRYELLLPIARGGMGVVFLGRSLGAHGFAREVAIKVLRSDQDDSFAGDLIREAEIAGSIRHPNVVQVLDVGDEAGEIYLVMEFVEGDSLDGLRRAIVSASGSLPLAVGLRVVLDGLAGLHAAHELRNAETGEARNLVHRDFSPQNLLISTSGITQLTDFGIAKIAEADRHTTAGVLKGKFSYMSPEQARSERLDRRADVWSAAVVAWEMVTNRRLFSHGNDANTLLTIVSKDPPDPREFQPELPSRLAEAIMSGLSRDLKLRSPTAQAFAQRLRDAAEQSDIEIAPNELVSATLQAHLGPQLAQRRAEYREASTTRSRARPVAEQSRSRQHSDAAITHVQAAPNSPLDATDPTVSELGVRSATKSRSPIAAVAGIGFLCVAGGGYLWSRASEPAASSVLRSAIAGRSSDLSMSTGPANTAGVSSAQVATATTPTPQPAESALLSEQASSTATAVAARPPRGARPTVRSPKPAESSKSAGGLKPKCPQWGRCQ